MTCPTEYTCAVFADGELPESEGRVVALHLETCASCSALVHGLRAENRLLVQGLQDVNLEEAETVPVLSSVSSPVGIGRFALGVFGLAAAVRLSTGIVFGIQLPVELEWMDPRRLALSLSVPANALVSSIENGGVAVTNVIQTMAVVTLAGFLLAAMARAMSRRTAMGSVFSVVAALALFASPSYATEIRKGPSASLPAGEIVDDTLVVMAKQARTINIAGTVKGDLLVVGDLVTISGTVEGNVIALARRVEITGTVRGSVIGLGETVQVTGQVDRNFLGGGTNIMIDKSAKVDGNVFAFADDTTARGDIRHDLTAFSGTLDARGGIGGNLNFRGDTLTVSAPARVGGNIEAHVSKENNVQIDAGAMIGGTRNVELPGPRPNKYARVGFYFGQVLRIAAAFIAGLILFWLAPSLMPRATTSGMDWLKAGGIGFITLVSIPIAVIVVAITIIGLPIALSSLALWVAGLYFAKIVVAQFIGRALVKDGTAMPLLVGLVLVVITVNLPFIGGLISFLLTLLGLGMLVVTLYRMPVWRTQRA